MVFVSRSQNSEDLFIANYFGDFKGTLLSIGENDGLTFSNSRLLIEHGWRANLIEPGAVFQKLKELYAPETEYWSKVDIFNIAIGDKNKIVTLHDSGAHVPNGTDRGLVSTVSKAELNRWPDVKFTERKVSMLTWDMFFDHEATSNFYEFISIDAEGFDEIILKQIDLEKVDCKCLCIEWNSDNELGERFASYCKGYKVGFMSAENLIFVK